MHEMLVKANAIREQIVADRRCLHGMPEVGVYTPRTAAYVKKRLGEMGICHRDCGVHKPEDREKMVFAGYPDAPAATGVVGLIGRGGPCILLRADMDGLPMEETTGLDFAAEGRAAHCLPTFQENDFLLGWQHAEGTYRFCHHTPEDEIDAQMAEYNKYYEMDTDNIDSVRYQAREEVAIKKFLDKEGFGAFHTNFEDLQGLRQLPGLASQDLMRQGYGFGAEGDWKVAAMTRIMKQMAEGLQGGTAFMEDYTYHFEPGNEMLLGSHMLEVCPTVAANKPKIQVHPLGIGDREDPARLVFKAQTGNAIVVTLVDMGDRLRMIVNDVECKEQVNEMPKLPVAGVLWKPLPCLQTSAEAWIYAGGAHHSVLSYSLTAEHMRDFAEIMGIEFVYINKDTEINSFRKELFYNDVAYKLGM